MKRDKNKKGEKMKSSGVKKNFAYQMIYEVFVLLLPFLTSPYIARVIGANGLGLYSYSHTVANYFVLFAMLGLKNHGNRVIAKSRDNKDELNKAFSNLLAIHLIVSALVCVAYIAYVVFFAEDKIYAIIQSGLVLSGLFDISWFYFGIEKFKLTVTRNTIIKILTVICVFAFVRNRDDLWIYCTIMSVGMLVSQLALWVPLKRYVTLVKPQWNQMTPHIKPMLILFIPTIAVSLYKYMDKIMIGSMNTKVQLGYYENAEKVINILMTVITSFGTVMLPKMSNLAAKKSKEVLRYINMSMDFINCLAFGLAFGLAGVGTVFSVVFWGDEFATSGYIIMGLAATVPFIAFANVIRTQHLIPNSRDKEYVSSVCIGGLLNLIINFILIPRFGAMGAMIGTVAAEASVCIIQAFVVRRDLPISKYLKDCLFYFIFGAVMFATVYLIGYFMGTGILTLLVQIPTGAVIYIVLCFLYMRHTNNSALENVTSKLKAKLKK